MLKHIVSTFFSKRSFVFFSLFALLTSSFSALLPVNVQAAGESYAWEDAFTINVNGGDLSEAGIVGFPDGSSTSGSVNFTLHKDSQRICAASGFMTLSADFKQGTLTNMEPISGVGGPAAFCEDDEKATISAYNGTTVSINGDRPSEEETEEQPSQRLIKVVLYWPGFFETAPESVKFTLKQGDTELKSFDSNKAPNGDDGTGYWGEFSDIDPGEGYVVCVDKLADPPCQGPFEKEKFKVRDIVFGEERSDKTISVRVEVQAALPDPAVETTFGPYDIILNNSEEVQVEIKQISHTYTPPSECIDQGNCPVDITFFKTAVFASVEPGNYKACFYDLRCVDAVKEEGSALEVELKVTQDDLAAAPTVDNEVLCSAGALGWFLCPLTEFLQNSTESVAGFIQNFLIYEPLINSDPQSKGSVMRTISGSLLGLANVGLAIAFLIIIYSQLTSAGLNNYGVKKMLPRLLITAILMNLSFYICALAVDITNLVGVGIRGIADIGFANLPDPPPGIDIGSTNAQNSFAVMMGLGLAGIAAKAGLLYFALPIFLTAAIAALTGLAVLVFREIVLTLLIIGAPLAFLAWVLPNTEGLFTKWRKAFLSLLAIFPIIMAIFYGSALTARIILTTSTPGSNDWVLTQLIVVGILAFPLFALPFILKSAGGVLERFGVLANNKSKGFIDRSNKWASESGKRTRQNTLAQLASKKWGGKNEQMLGPGNKPLFNRDGTPLMDDDLLSKGERRKRRAARTAARTSRFIGGYPTRRDHKMATNKAEAERIQQEGLLDLINETSPETGEATKRAAKYAGRAAGVGGHEGVARLQQLARDKERKEFIEETNRRRSDALSRELFDQGTKDVAVMGPDGKPVAGLEKLAVHERIGALGNGRDLTWTDSKGKKQVLRADEYWKHAAYSQMGATGDNKALSQTITGRSEELKRTFQKDADGNVVIGPDGKGVMESEAQFAARKARFDELKLQSSADVAAATQYVRDSDAFGQSAPHFRKGAGGAWPNASAAQIARFNPDEARDHIEYAQQQAALGNTEPMENLVQQVSILLESNDKTVFGAETRSKYEAIIPPPAPRNNRGGGGGNPPASSGGGQGPSGAPPPAGPGTRPSGGGSSGGPLPPQPGGSSPVFGPSSGLATPPPETGDTQSSSSIRPTQPGDNIVDTVETSPGVFSPSNSEAPEAAPESSGNFIQGPSSSENTESWTIPRQAESSNSTTSSPKKPRSIGLIPKVFGGYSYSQIREMGPAGVGNIIANSGGLEQLNNRDLEIIMDSFGDGGALSVDENKLVEDISKELDSR